VAQTAQNQAQDPDRELIAEFLAGNESAFNRLVLKHQQSAYNTAYGLLGNREEATEAAQDAFVRVYKNVHKFKWNASFKTWLYKIVLNLARSRYRKLKRQRQVINKSIDNPQKYDNGSEAAIEIPDEKMSPEKHAIDTEIREHIQAGLEALAPDFKEIMILRYVEELTYDEIAGILKINRGTVKSRIHRARQELKKVLSDYLSR
jgi:RNA polymerase sigma-70 factor, ECF subfamily